MTTAFGTLAQILERGDRLHDQSEIGTSVAHGIVEGMAPFRIKDVELYMDYEIDFHHYRLCGAAVLQNGYVIQYIATVPVRDIENGVGPVQQRLYDEMLQAFRNRVLPCIINDNIILGEN